MLLIWKEVASKVIQELGGTNSKIHHRLGKVKSTKRGNFDHVLTKIP